MTGCYGVCGHVVSMMTYEGMNGWDRRGNSSGNRSREDDGVSEYLVCFFLQHERFTANNLLLQSKYISLTLNNI